MECPICYTNTPTYVVNCGSTVEHTVCDQCEVSMRMKEPATREGRVLKCPMCRVPEKVPGKRTSFSYEYELSHMYSSAPVRQAPRVVQEDWASIADSIRPLPQVMQNRYIRMYPQLATYFEVYNPVIDLVERQPFAARVAPANQSAMRPPRPAEYHAFCQSGNRESGVCPTRGKTERKCSHAGCAKFVCRSCRQCLTH